MTLACTIDIRLISTHPQFPCSLLLHSQLFPQLLHLCATQQQLQGANRAELSDAKARLKGGRGQHGSMSREALNRP